MTRLFLIRRLIREVFGEQPNNDSNITDNYVNALFNEGIALAVKSNWKESVQLDGVAYINDSFISSYKGITISKDSDFTYKFTLPSIPIALGRNEGMKSLRIRMPDGSLSRESVPLTSSQKPFIGSGRKIPNRLLHYYEGNNCLIYSVLPLNVRYTAEISMVCAGDTDLTSEISLPEDALSVVSGYVSAILMKGRQMPKDGTNDGVDN